MPRSVDVGSRATRGAPRHGREHGCVCERSRAARSRMLARRLAASAKRMGHAQLARGAGLASATCPAGTPRARAAPQLTFAAPPSASSARRRRAPGAQQVPRVSCVRGCAWVCVGVCARAVGACHSLLDTVSAWVCVCALYACPCVRVCLHACMCTHACMCMYLDMCVNVCVCARACVRVCMCVRACISVSLSLCLSLYVYLCTG